MTEKAREFTIPSDALRYKVFKRKQGPLYIFTIDTSGSMAQRRIVAAKRILFGLLKRSYVNRDRVSIISFSGTKAKVLLPPSSSILRARRVLDALVVGGGTPLSAGLNCSLELAKRVAKAHGLSKVLLFTDGGANVSLKRPHETDSVMRQRLIDDEIRSLSANFQRANINITVVNTQDQFRSDTRVGDLASELNAPLVVVGSLEPFLSPPKAFDA
ncbi:MAG TPA: VWA domain-containing protein [Pyrinomonadaceae bacterium]